MKWQHIWNIAKSDYVKLVPILALAFFLGQIPSLNYDYAIHIDEWVHIAHSNELLRAGEAFYPDPFTGQAISGGEKLVALLEIGYHLPLALFYQISGLSWMEIVQYFPSIIFMLTVLSVYVFAKKMDFGWEAAFFTCLITTTIGMMGPAFMVPVALGLLFVPLLLYLVSNHKTIWSFLVTLVIIIYAIILHAPTGIVIATLIVPFIILNFRNNLKYSLLGLLAVALPFVVSLPWTYNLILSEAKNLFTPKSLSAIHDYLAIIPEYGLIPIIFCLLGIFILARRGGKQNYSLVLSLLLLLVLLAVFYTFGYGIHILYLRGILFVMLMISIVAGAGLASFRKLDVPWLNSLKQKRPYIIQTAGTVLCAAVIVTTLAFAIPDRLSTDYYHMIDKTDYEDFIWIRDNIDISNQKAILDPWKATAFTATTGKYVFNRIHSSPTPPSRQAYEFIKNGCTDTEFLRKNGITIIYTRINEGNGNQNYIPDNPDLVKVRESIYILE